MYIQNNYYTIYVHKACSSSSVWLCTSSEKIANLYVLQKKNVNEYAQYKVKQVGQLTKTPEFGYNLQSLHSSPILNINCIYVYIYVTAHL